jgi:hypothetical protein
MSHLVNKKDLELILHGELPSIVLNRILNLNDDLNKHDLADIFLDEFSKLDSKILPVIWHWKSAKSIRGMSDDQFNEAVLTQMREAEYLV